MGSKKVYRSKKNVSPEQGYNFSQEILNDLIDRGFSGETLKEEFAKLRRQVPEALKNMFNDKIESSKSMPVKPAEMSLDKYLDSVPDTD